MMYGWDNGMGAGGWVLMILAWVALIGLVVWAISRLFPARSAGDSREQTTETPEEILDRRLARGEIDTDEYARLRDALISAHARGGDRDETRPSHADRGAGRRTRGAWRLDRLAGTATGTGDSG